MQQIAPVVLVAFAFFLAGFPNPAPANAVDAEIIKVEAPKTARAKC